MYEKIVYDFVGTSGCGKTTIMKDITHIFEELGRSVNIVESSSRTMLKQFDLQLYDKTSDFTQCFISLLNWTNILESIQNYDVTLCTDLGVRSLVYTMYSPNNAEVTLHAHRKMVQFFASTLFSAKVMPIWVYLPLEIDMDINPDDEHRGYVKLAEHEKVCGLIRYVLQSLHLPHYILTGDFDERIDKMGELIYRLDASLNRSTHVGGQVL